MNTRKHLNILYYLISFLFILSIGGTILTFIAMIVGESALPFLICAILDLNFYLNRLFLNTIIEIYDAVVTK